MKSLQQLMGPASSLRRQLVRGSIGTIIVMVSGRLILLAVSVVLARLLGASNYGSYAFAMALVSLLAMPIQLGLPQLLLREIALLLRRQHFSLLKGLLLRANQLVLILSVVTAVVVAVVIYLVEPGSMAAAPQTLLWAMPLLPLSGLSALRASALRGMGQVIWSQIPESVLRPLIHLILIATVVFVIPGYLNDTVTIQLQLVAYTIAFAIGTWLLLSVLPSAARHTQPVYNSRYWLRSAVPFIFLAGSQLIIQYTDILMLGVLATAGDTGIYSVALQTSALVTFILTAVNMVLAPHIAQLYDADEKDKLQRIVTAAATATLIGALPFLLIFILFGREVLTLIFGDEFAAGYTALWILTLGQFVNAAMGSVGLILNMTGHAWYSSTGVFIGSLLNVLLNAILIPLYGMIGAAIATSASLILWNLLLAYWVYKRTGLISLAFIRTGT